METTDRAPARLRAAVVREAVRVSVEGELLDPSLGGWNRTFLRKAKGSTGMLRGRSRDRLDAAGEAFFQSTLRPRLLHAGVERVRRARSEGLAVLLESEGVDHVIRPLARELAADRFVAHRFEFRDGVATGRILSPPTESDTFPERGARPRAILVDDAFPPPLRVAEALAGRGILLIGLTGFIGKVWLANLLEKVPDLGPVHVLSRARGGLSAEERAKRVLDESPVFEGIRRRGTVPLRVHDGDVRRPGLGLGPEALAELRESVDVIVNCAGIVDFNPDPRDALAVNVDGVRYLLDLLDDCPRARLLHVSTCFVAGRREGRIPESIDPDATPAGVRIDAERELESLRAMVGGPAAAGPASARAGRPGRRAAIESVLERARELGWPNIYTYTKALGEALIARRGGERTCVVRPSIVESALEFPLRGWNEGVNTSAPLSHLLGTQFRQLPVNRRKRLDVIPVDLACRGMTLAAAALATGRHDPVVQLATSAVNPLDLRRAVELTALAHQKHYRTRSGWRSRILSHMEAVPVSRERYGRLSVPAQLRVVRAVNRWARRFRPGRPPLARAERLLQRVKELVDLYEPFLLDNEPVFEATNVEKLAEAVPPQERDSFGYDPRALDWYEYWIDIHIPGLRRWSFPLLEGRSVETASERETEGAARDTAEPAPVGAAPLPDPARR
ncbi:MAG TPA: SDR family oxidoreductase, partial [bacterium]|nr:SDR family oxidoreductase [bacterium]